MACIMDSQLHGYSFRYCLLHSVEGPNLRCCQLSPQVSPKKSVALLSQQALNSIPPTLIRLSLRIRFGLVRGTGWLPLPCFPAPSLAGPLPTSRKLTATSPPLLPPFPHSVGHLGPAAFPTPPKARVMREPGGIGRSRNPPTRRRAAVVPPSSRLARYRGYETFYSEYPECCVDVTPISQEKIESERALISQCGKPVLNISYRPAYDQGGPVEILPFLYLGSAYHASKCEFLANLHITALLNVSRRTSEACTTHLHYKWIPVEDSHTADISSHFQEAIDFIDCVREKGGKVLVHCEAGISRSPTICMAYLMKTKQFRLKDAFDYIKQRRSMISPNFGFMGQLLQYESEILPSTPTPQPASCQGEAAGSPLIGHLQTLSPDIQGTYRTFPASVLAPVSTHSAVSELHRSPVATATSC
ncbi:dual specificity protein phosphatase 5 [Carlito syrichta]|uniref:protein-tyrosine-phosphatase n=1 Tax=Carlito syrichta TaxID=1868482 RepID=A0A3Q0DXT2_CARSF|nr:dual specificity protein phosphatase 5 [Carlito syrichta]